MSLAFPSRFRAATHHAALPPPRRRGFFGRWLRRGLALAFLFALVYHGLPRALEIPPALLSRPAPGPEITDRSGRPLRRLLTDGQRVESLRFEDIPRDLIDATVSAEDQRFWTHGGIDAIGAVRAALDSMTAGRPVSGASTITQQLVKVAGERYHDRTWKDKLREMAYGRKLEITWSKERILTEYLQRVSYGNQATGCAAAARLYFQKPLADLSLAECAFLAGLPQAPTRLNPYRNFDRAKKRQEWILSRMEEDGRLTAAEAARAVAEPLRLRRWTGGFEAPHFVEMLLAAADGSEEKPGPSESPRVEPTDATAGIPVPEDRGSEGPVQTTLDLELQHFCEAALRRQLARLDRHHVREGAAVVIHNPTGGLRALVGSPDFFDPRHGQVNGALARRPAGSTLKPFTYLLALQNGASPATIVDDLPTEFLTSSGIYAPKNYDRRHYGPMSYREALANSLNLAAVRTLETLGGPQPLHQQLIALGLTSLDQPPDHYGLGLTIGNADVRLLELTNAYACLARLGHWLPVVLRTADEYRGPADAGSGKDEPPRLDPAACWLIADILSDPQARARCFGLDSPLRLDFPAAVKTGTSTDFRDNWCVGFTAEFTVGVWMGNFDHRPMDRVSGVSGAAPLWRDIMNQLETRHGRRWLERPAGVTEVDVDPLTGEQVPPEWKGQRPTVREKCLVSARPPVAPLDRYDPMGRVVLPREYARWLRGPENWLGAGEAVAGSAGRHPDRQPLRITSPVAGSTLLLDADLPDGGRRLPLRTNAPVSGARWSSATLDVVQDGDRAFARLVPGEHEIRLYDPGTGAEVASRITVRSL